VRKGGEQIHASVNGLSHPGQRRCGQGHLSRARDITAPEAFEANLPHRQKLASLGAHA
jgi:hypothetical protein